MLKKRTIYLILIDIIGLCLSYIFITMAAQFSAQPLFLFLAIGLVLFSNSVLGTYKQLWRFTSFREIQVIFVSYFSVFSVLIILHSLSLTTVSPIPLFNFFSFFLLYSLGIRGARRAYVGFKQQSSSATKSTIRVLIIGAGNSGSTLIKHILTEKKHIRICGILTNNASKLGSQIHGIPIIGGTDTLLSAIKSNQVQQVIIAMPSAPKQDIQSITQQLISNNISFKVVPHIRDMVDSHRPVQLNTITLDHLIDDKEFQGYSKTTPSSSQKKVLITGGSGYIGTHLTEIFLANDYDVILLDNHLYGAHGISHIKNHKRLHIIQGDIANIKDVVKSLQGVDIIIALAAIVGDPACGVNPQETLNLNYESSKILVETANFYGIKKLVFASSCSVYGVGGNDLLTEDSPLNPVSLYAKTRIMSENTIFERCDSVSPVILRLSTVFGYSPRMRFDLVVNLLTVKALVEKNFEIFGGNQWRPFIHCKDVAKAFFLAATTDTAITDRQIYNVGSSHLNYQLKDIGALIKQYVPETNYSILEGNVDERNYKVSFEKIAKELNFSPDYTLESGIQEMIKEIQVNSALQNYKNNIYSNLETLKSTQGNA